MKLEDKLKEASEGITIKAVPDKREEQIKLLEEKLAMCDKYYKEALKDLQTIQRMTLKYN